MQGLGHAVFVERPGLSTSSQEMSSREWSQKVLMQRAGTILEHATKEILRYSHPSHMVGKCPEDRFLIGKNN